MPITEDGRPKKLSMYRLKEFEKVVNEDTNAIIMTDEDLYFEVNKRVKKVDRMFAISYDTFRAYKVEVRTKKYEELEPRLQMFLTLYATAIFEQKKMLFKRMQADDKWWQRFAWIIERKFNDWNLKHITENNTNINVKVLSLSQLADEAAARERAKMGEHSITTSDAITHEQNQALPETTEDWSSQNIWGEVIEVEGV